MHDCMQAVQEWMRAAGMRVTTDAAGNLRGVYPGTSNLCLMIGSHLDTVPNSGAFDGILGVMMGLALVEALEGEMLPCSIEVVAFSEEEGVRFHFPFIGSRAVAGSLDPALLETKDADGISLAQAIRSFGLDTADLPHCVLGENVACFLEFHIEQGLVLESEEASLGVVKAIAGQTRAQVTFTGQARHAGTTPMRLRKDAVAAVAEWIVEVERTALATDSLVATVGDLHVHPGAGNVIAGQVQASLDVRHEDDTTRHHAIACLSDAASTIARRRGVAVSTSLQMDQPAVAMDPAMCRLAADAIRDSGLTPVTMISGAGHDAMILAAKVPTAMIFLRSPGGISHHPDETVRRVDVENALLAGNLFLRKFVKEKHPAHV